MADYHHDYEAAEKETKWNDIQRKLSNLPLRLKPKNPPSSLPRKNNRKTSHSPEV